MSKFTIPKHKQRTETTTIEHIKQLAELKEKKAMPKILLLGDSMFERFKHMTGESIKSWSDHGFDKFNIFNAGIGGDQIQNVLYRLIDQKILTHLGPSIEKVLLMIGTNNIENDKPIQMIEGVKTIIRIIKETYPSVTIYILGLPPRKRSKSKKNDDILEKIKQYNELLKSLPDKYIDTYELFIDDKNTINESLFCDEVHFNDNGYEIYTNLLDKLFV